VSRVFVLGFCMGGRMAFLSGSLGLELAGVIGFYGTLVGPWRSDAPEPVVGPARWGHRCWGCSGGADAAIPPEHVAAFERALTAAGVEHRLVTPGAPHSF
jgi:carboxymethylenebutenolidase